VRSALAAFAMDAVMVVLFAVVGRASHDEALTLVGVTEVAWPFLLALTLGWGVAARSTGRWPVGIAGSVIVWLVTVVLGLVLRVATGGGFAWSFGVVTLIVLGLFSSAGGAPGRPRASPVRASAAGPPPWRTDRPADDLFGLVSLT
jgi:hypothetical protein